MAGGCLVPEHRPFVLIKPKQDSEQKRALQKCGAGVLVELRGTGIFVSPVGAPRLLAVVHNETRLCESRARGGDAGRERKGVSSSIH